VLNADRSLEDSLGWTDQGTGRLLAALATLPDDGLDEPTTLPGWTRRHLLAHIAANAEALINLTNWARTGVPTPMYASPQQRAADIEAGSRRAAADLRAWVADSAAALGASLAGLDPGQWGQPVRTAQGRTVPAEEIPWMRAREVMVHTVDLDAGVGFADLPADFLAALADDIAAKRSAAGDGPALILNATDHDRSWTVAGTGTPSTVTSTLADLTAYLAGRAVVGAPELPPWL
jgi:maleylpyruvate isomerase